MTNLKSAIVIAATVLLIAGLVQASPTIQFADQTGNWTYQPYGQGHGLMSITPTIVVTKGYEPPKDSLRGATVNFPKMTVASTTNGEFKLTPKNSGKFSITDATGNTTFLTGTLGAGNLVPVGTDAQGYTVYQADITSIQINNSIDSAALKRISELGPNPQLDLALTFKGATPGIKEFIDKGTASSGSIKGALAVVPAPGAILLGSLGVGIVGWLRRRRTL